MCEGKETFSWPLGVQEQRFVDRQFSGRERAQEKRNSGS